MIGSNIISMITNFSSKKIYIISIFWLILHLIIFGPYSYFNWVTAFNYPPELVPLQEKLLNQGYWNELHAGGADRLGLGFQSKLGLILFYLLPDKFVFFILDILMVIIPVVYTKKLLIEYFNVEEKSAMFAGIFYGSLFVVSHHLMFSNAILPLIIYYLEKISISKKKNITILSYVILLSLFWASVSHIPYAIIMIFPALFFWFVFIDNLEFLKNKKKLFVLFLFCFFIICFRLQDLITISNSFPESIRIFYQNNIGAGKIFLNEWSKFINNSIDESSFYLNTSFLIIIIISITSIIKYKLNFYQQKMIQIFIIFFSIPLILPFIKFLPEIFSSISINRAFDSYSFYISLFLGICLVNIINKNKSIFYISVILLFISTLETKLVATKSWIKEGSYTYKFESNYLKKLSKTKNEKNIFRVEGIGVPLTLFLPAYGFEIFSGESSIKKRSNSEYWRLINYPGEKIEFDKPSRRLRMYVGTKSAYDIENFFNFNLLSLANVKYFISKDEIFNENLIKIKSSDKIWKDLSTKEKIRINFKENFYGINFFNVYENKNYLKRFFFVKNSFHFKNKEFLINKLMVSDIELLKNNVFLNMEELGSDFLRTSHPSCPDFNKNIKVLLYESDKIIIRTNTQVDSCILVITNTFNKNWNVYYKNKKDSNLEKGKIFKTYNTFWGVEVPKGNYEIIFKYEPFYSDNKFLSLISLNFLY